MFDDKYNNYNCNQNGNRQLEEDERILRGDKEDRYNERGRISICVYLTLKIYKVNVAVLARLRTSFGTNIILINSPQGGVYNSERPIS